MRALHRGSKHNVVNLLSEINLIIGFALREVKRFRVGENELLKIGDELVPGLSVTLVEFELALGSQQFTERLGEFDGLNLIEGL